VLNLAVFSWTILSISIHWKLGHHSLQKNGTCPAKLRLPVGRQLTPSIGLAVITIIVSIPAGLLGQCVQQNLHTANLEKYIHPINRLKDQTNVFKSQWTVPLKSDYYVILRISCNRKMTFRNIELSRDCYFSRVLKCSAPKLVWLVWDKKTTFCSRLVGSSDARKDVVYSFIIYRAIEYGICPLWIKGYLLTYLLT